jgi:TolB-like protein/tetratricopeptide (TPR) repeat protein
LTRKESNSHTAGVEVSTVLSRGGVAVASDDARAELERVLSSPHFLASERRRTFLRFIVSETLSGRAERLKGYTIALSVFGRTESFDPQADPVVRLEARRLRRDLDSYYVDAGQNDTVRISIPKGSYVPIFEWHNVPPVGASTGEGALDLHRPAAPDTPEMPTPAPRGFEWGTRSTRFRISLIAVALAVGLTGWIVPWRTGQSPPDPPREPAVVVVPFEALSPDENARYFALGMSRELVSNLFRFTGFRLYTWPAGSDQESNPSPGQLARTLGIAYLINGAVQTKDGEVRVTATVSNAASGEVVWSRTFARPLDPASLMDSQRDLASEIAALVGQSYGIVNDDIDNSPPQSKVSNIDSYRCVLRAYRYRRTFLRAELDPVMQCLEETIRRDPEYSDAWAMLGWLHVDAGRLGNTGDDNRQKEYEKALEATSRAVRLQPNNPLSLKALASAFHFLGRYAESDRLSRQAAHLNPNDSDLLAQFGWRLAIRGNFSEGVPMLKRAIERSVSPPGWYFHFVAVDLYLKGDYQQMLGLAERAALSDSGFSQLLIAVANTELGNRDAAKRALENMSRYEPLARDPEAFLRRNGATDQIVDALAADLQKVRTLQ